MSYSHYPINTLIPPPRVPPPPGVNLLDMLSFLYPHHSPPLFLLAYYPWLRLFTSLTLPVRFLSVPFTPFTPILPLFHTLFAPSAPILYQALVIYHLPPILFPVCSPWYSLLSTTPDTPPWYSPLILFPVYSLCLPCLPDSLLHPYPVHPDPLFTPYVVSPSLASLAAPPIRFFRYAEEAGSKLVSRLYVLLSVFL